jgi:hypothetical protein
MKEQEEEELIGVRAMVMEQWRACKEDGDLPEHGTIEEEEWRQR